MNQEKWTEINQDFEKECNNKTYWEWWVETGLTRENAEEWLKVGLTVVDYKFIDWLKHWRITPSVFSYHDFSSKKNLEERFNSGSPFCDNCGKNISRKVVYFSSRQKNLDFCSQECYQGWETEKERWSALHSEFFKENEHNILRRWKERGITFSEAQDWINMGFEPKSYDEVERWRKIGVEETKQWLKIGFNKDDYGIIQEWKANGFNFQQAKQWLKIGFNIKEINLVSYLQNEKKLTPEECVNNLKELKENWLKNIKNWEIINPKFVEKPLDLEEIKNYQELWQKQKFNAYQVDQYLKQGFEIDDFIFLTWLRDNEKLTLEQINSEQIKTLRVEYQKAWNNLSSDFGEYHTEREIRRLPYSTKEREKTYWKRWEWYGINYDEAQKWINADFKPKDYKKINEWKEKHKFTPEQTKSWLEVGLKIDEFNFAKYLQEQRYQPDSPNIHLIIQNESWRDIHSDFNYSLRQEWENLNCNHQKTKEWSNFGFKPHDYDKIKQWQEIGIEESREWLKIGFDKNNYDQIQNWKKNDFILQEAKEWISAGLNKNDHELATYLKFKRIQPRKGSNKEELEESFTTWKNNPPAQEYLDIFYPLKQRDNVTKLNLNNKNLTDYLNLNDFVNLEELECSNNKLTSLNINNCPKLKKIECINNQLTELKIDSSNNISKISAYNNKLTELDLSKLNNLEKIDCSNNYLKDLYLPTSSEKLNNLDIGDNNFSEQELTRFSDFVNLEYLAIGNNCSYWGEEIKKKTKEKIQLGVYNRWIGSLSSLQKLTNLEILYIDNTDLNDGLDCLPNSIKEIYCSSELRGNNKLKEKLVACRGNEKYTKKRNAQEWLDQNYPQNERDQITNLKISEKGLVGKLKLTDFKNLIYLDCSYNELTELDLTGLTELKNISFNDNLIKGFNFNCLNPEKLTILDIKNNNLFEQDLSIFSNFIKLEHLLVGSDNKEKIDKGEFNRFTGSLSSLKNLSSLEILDISNTDVNEVNVEELSKHLSTKTFFCSFEKRPESGVRIIAERLNSHFTRKCLNEMYPERSVKVLDNLYSESLKGHLDLSDYPDLEELNCRNNQLTSLDISKNTKLKRLFCYNNQLENIDLKNNTNLEKLIINNNKLKELNLQKLTSLVEIKCSNNGLNAISNVEDCNNLSTLECEEGNKLSPDYQYYLERFLKYSQRLKEAKEKWKEVDVQEWLEEEYPRNGKCRGLFNLEDKGKERWQIKELDISSIGMNGDLNLEGFAELIYLNCSNNKLKSIDLSDCKKIDIIDCSSNELNKLIINNSILKLKELHISKNKIKDLENIISKIDSNTFTYFDITDNEVVGGKVSSFKDFKNLEFLLIGNSVYSEEKRGNNFDGSLSDLKDLKRLREINVCNNGIKIKTFLNKELSSDLEKIFYSFSELDELIKKSQEIKVTNSNNNKESQEENSDEIKKLKENIEKIEIGYFGTDFYNVRKKEIDGLWNNLLVVLISEESKKFLKELLEKTIKNNDISDDKKDLSLIEIKEIRDNKMKLKSADNLYKYDKENGFYKKERVKSKDENVSMEENDEIKSIVKLPVSLKKLENRSILDEFEEKKDQENYYNSGKLIYPSEEAGFSWNIGNKLELNKLPHRLCYINKKDSQSSNDSLAQSIEEEFRSKKKDYQVEIKRRIDCVGKKNQDDAKYYAILSYSWEGDADKEKKWSPESAQERMSAGGKKSLKKALDALEVLNNFHLFKKFAEIKYLWMDQMCINQDNHGEKQHEVSRMREYYGNSAVTLVAIHENVGKENMKKLLKSFEKGKSGLIYPNEIVRNSLPILKKIVDSGWFSRSWTFQEGFLSKQTIFMFNDFLIDGRFMALIWKLSQFSEAYYDECVSLEELCLDKIATPIGWTYYKQKYSLNDKVSLHLNEALWAIKKRKQAIPLDGIYSIVGLLPYGTKINIDYDKDLESVLREVMLIAAESGYGDLLSWHGSGIKKAGLCWMPEIDKSSGSSSIKGNMNIKYKYENSNNKKLKFEQNKGIWIVGSEYFIEEKDKGIYKLELEETVEGGLWKREVWVSNRNEENENLVKLILSGTREGIEAIGKDRTLLIPNDNSWESDKPFAILLLGAKKDDVDTKKKINELKNLGVRSLKQDEELEKLEEKIILERKNNSARHRIDLLRIEEGCEKLNQKEKETFIIGLDSQKESDQKYQTQIEISPKS